jgi:hypothetical protein
VHAVRRTAVAATVLGLVAAAGSGASASVPHAAKPTGTLTNTFLRSQDDGCTLSSALPGPATRSLASSGKPTSLTRSVDVYVVASDNTNNLEDRAATSTSGRVSTKSGGVVTGSLSAHLSASTTALEGSSTACDADYFTSGATSTLAATMTRPFQLRITTSAANASPGTVQLSVAKTGGSTYIDSVDSADGSSTLRFSLPKGTWTLAISASSTLFTPGTSSAGASLTATFTPGKK